MGQSHVGLPQTQLTIGVIRNKKQTRILRW